jgi:hypothetical protein
MNKFFVKRPGQFFIGFKRFHFVRVGKRWIFMFWNFRIYGFGFRFVIGEIK